LLELATRLEASLAAPYYPVAQQEVGSIEDRPRMRSQAPTPAYAPLPREQIDLDVADDELRSDIVEAVREHRRLQIRYIKSGDTLPRERTVSPYTLVYANGSWYIIGRDEERAAVRTFRMDRILDARALAETFTLPDSYSPESYIDDEGRVLRSQSEAEATVRYSARIARWVQERMPSTLLADGSVEVTHKVADPHWLIAHVLQYGADAEIIAPAVLRSLAAATASKIASAA
jgi:predicted DNA-binding transcriptional regulator YafY